MRWRESETVIISYLCTSKSCLRSWTSLWRRRRRCQRCPHICQLRNISFTSTFSLSLPCYIFLYPEVGIYERKQEKRFPPKRKRAPDQETKTKKKRKNLFFLIIFLVGFLVLLSCFLIFFWKFSPQVRAIDKDNASTTDWSPFRVVFRDYLISRSVNLSKIIKVKIKLLLIANFETKKNKTKQLIENKRKFLFATNW